MSIVTVWRTNTSRRKKQSISKTTRTWILSPQAMKVVFKYYSIRIRSSPRRSPPLPQKQIEYCKKSYSIILRAKLNCRDSLNCSKLCNQLLFSKSSPVMHVYYRIISGDLLRGRLLLLIKTNKRNKKWQSPNWNPGNLT